MQLPIRHRRNWLPAIAAAVALASVLGARVALATTSVSAAAYRVTAECYAYTFAAAAATNLPVPGGRICDGVDNLGQILARRGATSPVLAAQSASAPEYPLKLSASGRYLVDQRNTPFLLIGDSPQSMVGNISSADMEGYFANREAYGVNTVWVSVLCNVYLGCHEDGSTFDGLHPFTSDDLTTPDDAYFRRVDDVVRLAGQHHMNVLLDPIDTGGWLETLRRNGPQRAYSYGLYLGQRYAQFPNIVWMSGNDFQTWRNADDDALVLAVARGIRNADAVHLQTVELDYYRSASLDDPNWQPLIDLDAAYTYSPTYAEVLQEYNRAPFLPVVMVEANYELEHDYTGPQTLRRQAYWSALSGAAGQFYGSNYTWAFRANWQNHLNTPGAAQMGLLRQLLQPRRWYDLIPDQDHRVVVDGYGTFAAEGSVNESDYVTAARTSDGMLAMAYVPGSRTVRVDMSTLAAPVHAFWYDPSNGTSSQISAGGLLPATGTVDFATPGRNSDGDMDWVLVLEVPTSQSNPDAPLR